MEKFWSWQPWIECKLRYLTRFCTMHILSLLNSATSPYMSTKSWSFICCVKWSRAMNTPVLPTPALQGEWNHRDCFQQRFSCVEGDDDGEVWYRHILRSFFSLAGDRFFYLETLCMLIFTKTVYKHRKMLCLITILLLSEINTQGKCWAVIFKWFRSLWEVSFNQEFKIANPVLIEIF